MGEYSKGKATRNRAFAVYKSEALRSVNIKLRLFPFSLLGKAKQWFYKEKKEQEREKMGMRTSTYIGPCSLRARFGR